MLNPLIDTVRRELRIRGEAYPRMVAKGSMSASQADTEIQNMTRVLQTMQAVARLAVSANDFLEMLRDADSVAMIHNSPEALQLLKDLRDLQPFTEIYMERQRATDDPKVRAACYSIRSARDLPEMQDRYRAADHITDAGARCALNRAAATWRARNPTGIAP